MYILSYEHTYEGQIVLGVYSTLDHAMGAVGRHGISAHGDWREGLLDDLVIRELTLDADPEFEAGRIVWYYDGVESYEGPRGA
jgi:hypothetical protein